MEVEAVSGSVHSPTCPTVCTGDCASNLCASTMVCQLQNAKDYENTSERYGLGLAPASSSHALSSANMQLRLGQRSPGRDSDESDDDITIMVSACCYAFSGVL